jgi:hypothetical protein
MPLRFFEVYILLILLLWAVMIANCILTKHLQTREKFLWLLVLLLVPILGGFIYFFAEFLRRVISSYQRKES